MSEIQDNKHMVSKPYLNDLLSTLKMDKNFVRGDGNYLYAQLGDQTIQYLDFAGGYGSLLLGHNHPQLIQKITELYGSGICSHHQLSMKPNLELLCREINNRIKANTGSDYHITVFNTGSEAVEAAIKHALLTYNSKIEDLEKEIQKNLNIIRDAFIKGKLGKELILESQRFDSIEDLGLHLRSINRLDGTKSTPIIMASDKAFHGKTLGALSLTANPTYRSPFIKRNAFETVFVPISQTPSSELFAPYTIEILIPHLSSTGQLAYKRKKLSRIVAVLIEPIVGEGGIHEMPKTFLSTIRELTETHEIPLIFDEVQSGCYRTGPFLASFHYSINADYYVLGKALGGGITKISALCVSKDHYLSKFDLLHSSTFAEDDISSCIALESLAIMDRQTEKVREAGAYLMESLNKLKCKYPTVLKEIRGKGLMIGVSLWDFNHCNSYGLQGISRSPYFGYVLSAFLLNAKQVRVSITLSDPFTIRLMPSMLIQKADIDKLLAALEDLCLILSYGDFYSLISFLLPEEYQNLRPVKNYQPDNIPLDDMSDCNNEVGFLLHYIDANTVREYLPSLAFLPDDIISQIIQRLEPYSEPVIIGRNKIRNRLGESIGITFVGLSFTSKMVSDAIRSSIGNIRKYRDSCNKGIALLLGLGIQRIGLGQYTSIIMQNGKSVSNAQVNITSGNGFTVYAALRVAKKAIHEEKSKKISVGIIGAAGNIGRILSLLLSEMADTILLVGRSGKNQSKLEALGESILTNLIQDQAADEKSKGQLAKQAKEFANLLGLGEEHIINGNLDLWNIYSKTYKGKKRIVLAEDLNALKSCNLVMVATNDTGHFLKRDYFKKGTIICDISVPPNCEPALFKEKDIMVVKGGILDLPYGEELYPRGLGLKKGEVYACMAETMLMGFSSSDETFSYGDITREQVLNLGARLKANGFSPEFRKPSHSTIKT